VLRFINKFVDKEAKIQTNDREIFSIIGKSGYKHEVSTSEDPEKYGFAPKPRVRIEIDRVRRWLSTTHHGRVNLKYLQSYLEEYAFRHNRRLHEDIGHTFIRLVLHSVNIHHQLKMSDFD
ncbi:MAG: transposase, partial [Planctomycetota bacterium]